ncbi:MAG: Bacterial rane protein YfhO [Acidobacteria bacterium]|nr:Bacterial rane protein YfhO [Acidobacteriota bacterium]
MSLLLYTVTAAVLLLLVRRFIAPLSNVTALVLFLIPFCLTGRALLTDSVYGPIDLPYITEPLARMRIPLGVPEWQNGTLSDLYAQMIPWRAAVRDSLRHGQWPIWNRFMLSGTLLAPAAQAAAYSPFTLLACILPVAKGLTYSATLTFFIAALGAFLFARDLGCRDSAAMIAAAGFAFSTPLAFFVLWAIGVSWSFLPFVLLGTRRCVREPSLRSATILMIAFTFLLLSGHPETSLHVVFLGAIYGVFELALRRRELVRPIALAVGAGVVALMLCAIYVLPIVDAAPQTMEHQYRAGAWSQEPRGAKPAVVRARLLTDFFPMLHGLRFRAEGVGYVPLDASSAGSVVLALALYGIWRARRKESWFFTGMLVFCLLARADWPPLSRALQKLPLFNLTINERFSFGAAFCFALLAALGVEELLRRGGDRAFGCTLAATFVAIAAGIVLIDRAQLTNGAQGSWMQYTHAAELLLLGAAAIAAVMRPQLRLLAPLMLAAILGQRIVEAGHYYPTLPAAAAYPDIPILRSIRDSPELFRFAAMYHGLVPGTSTLYGLEDVRGYEAMTFSRYAATYDLWCIPQSVWFNRIDDATRPFLSFLNVRYVLTSSETPVPAGWRVIAEQRGARVIENPHVLPRAFLPRIVRLGANDGSRTLLEMGAATDFSELAWFDTPLLPQDRANGNGELKVAREGNDFHIVADMKESGWVVLSEPAWEGWRVYIDDRRVHDYFANFAFVGFFVPQGHHDVRVVFLPRAFVVGRAVTFATLFALIAAAIIARRRQRPML